MAEDRGKQTGDEALLKEIRDRYRYASDCWAEIRKESQTDRKYLTGDPWEDEDRKARADNGRPCISHDELTQYVNQSVNFVRQNKRGIKVTPAGNGADEKTAELRQGIMRTIEYRSNAQPAYITAFEQMVEGSYGFFRISRRYTSNDPTRRDASVFDQEIVIKTIPNPDSVLYDPDCKEPDFGDAGYCFVLDPLPKDEFKTRFPGAEVKDFTTEDMRVAKDWIQDKIVLVAEYWKVEIDRFELYLLESGEIVDALPKGEKAKRRRTVESRQVVQYITNGIEILERNEQPGEEIPIPAMIGKQMYVEEGGATKRKIFSLPRLARDPQMSLAYLCSQEMEEAGMSPKVPVIGYKGQFESDAEAWELLNKVPRAFVQIDPVVDGADNRVLPLPQWRQFTPNFQQYEIAKDSCRRAIQAAMGISPLPTAAQRNNEKSGVALERIQAQQGVGSFHFVDNFERALQRAGRIIDSWIPVVYDTEREMALRKPDDSHDLVRLNTEQPYEDPHTHEPRHFPVDGQGDHDVTISTGPSYQSQQDAVSDFLDMLVGNLGKLPVAPPQAAKLLSLAIQMKQLGPKGDQMAEIISPPDNQELPPQAMQAVQGLQQKMQALNAYAQQKEAEIQELQRKLDAQVVNNEYRKDIERMKIEADLAKAEIATKAQNLGERMAFVEDMIRQLNVQRHEAEMKVQDQAHQADMAQSQQQAEAAAQEAQEAQQPPQPPPTQPQEAQV